MRQLYRVWIYENGILSFMSQAMAYDPASLCSEQEVEKLTAKHPGLKYDWDKGIYVARGIRVSVEIKEV